MKRYPYTIDNGNGEQLISGRLGYQVLGGGPKFADAGEQPMVKDVSINSDRPRRE